MNPCYLVLFTTSFIDFTIHMDATNTRTLRIQLNDPVLTRTIPIRIALARLLLQFLRNAHQNIALQRAKHQQRAREIATPRILSPLPTAAPSSIPRRTPSADRPRVFDSSHPPS